MPATILVVDDDQTIRELLQLHLRNAGYAVHVAEDAVEAGHLVLRSPPDLIISDVNMPHMDVRDDEVGRRAQDQVPCFHRVLGDMHDLIISDVNMPHMDGFEFIAAVRSDDSLPYIPVIFLTSEE